MLWLRYPVVVSKLLLLLLSREGTEMERTVNDILGSSVVRVQQSRILPVRR